MGFFIIYLFLYLPLLIIGIIFLVKSVKRKNVIQIIIFSACIIFCGYSILAGLAADLSIRKKEKEYEKAAFKNLSAGDTATIEGTIIFMKTDPYKKQDSINKLAGIEDSLNRIHLVMPVMYFGRIQEEDELIILSPHLFESLTEYLNYEQQIRDSISYNLRIKVQKINEDLPHHWRLLEIIKIRKLNKPPYPI